MWRQNKLQRSTLPDDVPKLSRTGQTINKLWGLSAIVNHVTYSIGSTRTLKSSHGGSGRGGGEPPYILNIDNKRTVDSFTIHLVLCCQAVQWIGYMWDGVKIPQNSSVYYVQTNSAADQRWYPTGGEDSLSAGESNHSISALKCMKENTCHSISPKGSTRSV
jgi:hypothetical protein